MWGTHYRGLTPPSVIFSPLRGYTEICEIREICVPQSGRASVLSALSAAQWAEIYILRHPKNFFYFFYLLFLLLFSHFLPLRLNSERNSGKDLETTGNVCVFSVLSLAIL